MSARSARETFEEALPLLVLVLLFVLAFGALRPFLPAIVWAIILGISLRPFHSRLAARIGRPILASLLVGLLLTVTLVIPIAWLSRALVAFLPDVIHWLSAAGLPSLAPDGAAQGPVRAEFGAVWAEIMRDLLYIRDHFGDEIRPVVFWIIGEGRLIGAFVIEFALGVLLAVMLLHRAVPIGRSFMELVERVGGSYAHDLAERSIHTVRSTVFGVLGSAAAQTAVASVAFVIVGAPHWPILSLATFVLGMIQIGPVLVWLPLCVWLWFGGETGMAIFLGLWGVFVVGLVDNVVKAVVVSRGADLPAILAFLGAIGGLVSWGILGLFVGPVVVAITYQLLLVWLRAVDPTPNATPPMEAVVAVPTTAPDPVDRPAGR